ncbi:hypothetical protein HY620_03250 [Candidatus Uhrbacteria bacterium]|nr:hypothetical protein [Candidatus Uhrbacteria bacterium]
MIALLKITLLGALLLALPGTAHTLHIDAGKSIQPPQFIRTANYFLRAGYDLRREDYDRLASFDLLVLPMEAGSYNTDFFAYARSHNPNIIILAYVPCRSINIRDLDDGAQIRKRMKAGIHPNWYLMDSRGNHVSAWPGTLPINITTPWNEYLPTFIHEVVYGAGLWDGIFYDEFQDDMTYLNQGDVDIDRDGSPDPRPLHMKLWQEGNIRLLQKTRELMPNAIILTNGSSKHEYQVYTNGRMFENFPTPWEGHGQWIDTIRSYFRLFQEVSSPQVFFINGTTRNTGNYTDYKSMRFGLTSTLLGDGYFGFDFGDTNHGQLWQYDEFNTTLGKPSGTAHKIEHQQRMPILHTSIAPGVWMRDYQKGAVFVNSTSQAQRISLDEDYEKLRGAQDPVHNNGSIVSSLTLDSQDGIILLRPLKKIIGAFFPNGSFARVFDKYGTAKRNGFFAYEDRFRGSTKLMEFKDSDGLSGTVQVDKNGIRILDTTGIEKKKIYPFGESWPYDINIGAGRLTNNGPLTLAVGPEYPTSTPKSFRRSPSTLKLYALPELALIDELKPLGATYTGSLRVAIGRFSKNGDASLVVTQGQGSLPDVRMYTRQGKLIGVFSAYNKSFHGGISIATGDIDGNGVDEIITGPSSKAPAHIRVFDAKSKPLSPGFLALDIANKKGVQVAATDLDGDGKAEILVMTNHVFTAVTSNE